MESFDSGLWMQCNELLWQGYFLYAAEFAVLMQALGEDKLRVDGDGSFLLQ